MEAPTTTDDRGSGLRVRKIAERYFAACNAHDADAMVAMWEPGGTEDYPPFEEGYRAPEALHSHLSSWFAAAPDVHWEVASITADAQRAVVHSTMSGMWEGRFQGFNPRRRFAIEGVDIIEIRGGKIIHNTCLFDTGAMMREVGVLPRRHSRLEAAAQRALNGIWRVRRAIVR